MDKISLKENNLDLNEILQAVKSLPTNVPSQEKEVNIIENNTNIIVEPDNGKTLSKVNISTNIPTQEKEIFVSETGTYEIIPDDGNLLSKVTVEAEVALSSDGLLNYLAGETDYIIDNTVFKIGNSTFASAPYSAAYFLRPLSGVELPNCSYIGKDAFSNCYTLENASLANCTYIGSYAFYSCSSLRSIYAPKCLSIGTMTFLHCPISSAIMPECSTIGAQGFYNCSKLKEAYFPACQSISSSAFGHCSSLYTINIQNCQDIGSAAFSGCKNLPSIDVPRCTHIGSAAFAWCQQLKWANLDSCQVLFSNTFEHCYELSQITLPVCSKLVGSQVFYNCSKLTNLTLKHPRIVSLSSANTFYGTPMSSSAILGYYGSIYVPSSLVSAYKSATNWTVYKDRIVGIPEINFSNKIYMLPNEQKTFNIKLEGFTSSPNVSFNNPNNIFVRMQTSTSDINLTLQAPAEEMILSGLITINYNGIPIEKSFTIVISNNPIIKDYSIENLGTTYSFSLNNNDYYESNNKGIDSSFALCKVNINTTVDTEMYVDCINYAESNYDFGILSKLDTTLALSNSEDSDVQKNFKGSQSSLIQTVQYSVPAGEHFIYIKFIKDSSQSSNNDSLQFKIRFV